MRSLGQWPGRWLFALICTIASLGVAIGQEEEKDVYEVERVKVVDQDKPIYNIYIDSDNKKWVGNSEAIFFVEAKDVAEKRPIPPGQQSLLQLPGGDADIRWSRSEIEAILGQAKITTAAFNAKDNMLWIGTDGWGVYKIRVNGDGSLRLVEEIYIDNSKLRSDFINLIYIAPSGKVWIATEDGAMLIDGGSSSMYQKYFNIQTISGNRRQTWATGDGIVWTIDNRDNWTPIEINKREIEGEMHDIAFDDEGRIWIASNIMTAYDVDTDTYEHFGPGQYFTSQFVNYVSVDDDGTVWVGTDDKGVYIIMKESTISVTTNLDKGLSCAGDQPDAAVTVRAVGGTPPYTFKWSDGPTGKQRTDLAAGQFVITVTDTEGSTSTAEVEITDPSIELQVIQEQEESGEGMADGIAVAETSGGVPGYDALWSTGATGARLTGLAEGIYSVTVTDQSGCTAAGEVQITRALADLTVGIELTQEIKCVGGEGADMAARVAGGREPYQYAWSDIAGTSAEIRGVTPGTYVVTVTDAEGNTASSSIDIANPAEFKAAVKVDQSAATNAADGQASVTMAGGQKPFTYAWSNGETTAQALGLPAGEHSVTVTDANGCTATAEITMSEDILPLEISISQRDNILCAGESTGSLQVDVSGGKPPFSYAWSTGEAIETLDGLPSGIYSVTVTDAAGSTSRFETELPEPAPLVANAKVTASADANKQNGSATVTAEGGTGDYTYAWDIDQATADLVDVGAGTYTVTITDVNGCTATTQVTMTEDILPLSVSIEQQADILCNGESTGGLLVDVTGGKSPYTYAWSDANSSQVRQDLGAGTYAVTVTDVTGTNATFETELTQPEALVLNVVSTKPASTGASDGIALATATGGTPEFNFEWDTGANTAEAAGLSPGTHSVTVTDANGCSATGEVTISEDILPLAAEIQITSEIACHGEASGGAAVNVTGGKAPFEYQWSSSSDGWAGTGNNTRTVSALPSGAISVTVTDAVGNETVYQAQLTQPERIVLNARVESPATTNNADGVAVAEASGGTGSFSYRWDNGETTARAESLAPGDHSVTVTDEEGCEAIAELSITEDILPLLATIEATSTPLCNDDATGALAVRISGGKAPFSYIWNDGTSGDAISNLTAGSYDVTVTDAAGTQVAANYSLLNPEPLSVRAYVEQIASTDAADGTVAVAADGGTLPHSYLWSDGSTEKALSDIPAGTYTVTVTDVNGCTAAGSVDLTEDIQPLTLDIERDNSQLLCHGQPTGIANAIPQGGKGPFTYAWSDGSTGGERNDLPAASYTVTVTDGLGASATAMVIINEPEVLVVETLSKQLASTGESNGRAEAVASGGTAPYSFEWSNGETNALAEALPAGEHTVTVTDDNGCTAASTVEITEDILPLAASIEQIAAISCNGESTAALTVTVTGGKGPFEILWSQGGTNNELNDVGAGTYNVTVRDAVEQETSATIDVSEPDPLIVNASAGQPASTDGEDGQARAKAEGGTAPYSFSWSNGETEASAEALPAGEHAVTVTDANGCTAEAAVTITEDILPLAANVEQTRDIACHGETTAALSLTLTGGKGPFSIIWSNGETGQEVTLLGAGTYSVTITDAVGQETQAAYDILQPETLIVNVAAGEPANTDQSDGQAQATATGGQVPYTYSWSNGESEASATALPAGEHEVTVTDASGCTATGSVTVTEDILPLAASGQQTEEIACNGESTAAISLDLSGGKQPYNISWSNGATETDLSGLAAGVYSATITDAVGQEAQSTVEVTQPEALIANITVGQPANTDQSDGQAQASASGGTPPYTYAWSNGESAGAATQLPAGEHTVSVTDVNGCMATALVTITEDVLPLALTLSQSAEISCAGAANAGITASVSGGKGPFEYEWSDAGSGKELSGLGAGTYALTVTDAIGQSAEASIEVAEPEPLRVEVSDVRPAAAEHVADGKAILAVNGGSGGYSYSWDNGESIKDPEGLAIGDHTVTVTDANGCTAVATASIAKRIIPELTAERLESGEPVRMEQLQFEADSTRITSESVPTLTELYQFLYDNPTIVVEIGGHTNGLPEHDYCDSLSTLRAKSVAQYIVQKGIDEKRVYYKGYGKRKPIATNRTPEGRRRNQRVEVRILRIGD